MSQVAARLPDERVDVPGRVHGIAARPGAPAIREAMGTHQQAPSSDLRMRSSMATRRASDSLRSV